MGVGLSPMDAESGGEDQQAAERPRTLLEATPRRGWPEHGQAYAKRPDQREVTGSSIAATERTEEGHLSERVECRAGRGGCHRWAAASWPALAPSLPPSIGGTGRSCVNSGSAYYSRNK